MSNAVPAATPSTISRTSPPAPSPPTAAARFLPLLLLLFLGSGCAALIYEIVWFQLLQLVIGSNAISIAVLLGTFMGGMCLGSLLFARLISNRHHPLRIYALLELSIGAVALAVTLGMPLFDHLYVALSTPGPMAVIIRAIVCALCLLPPTILMGATLPAISRWIENTPRGVSWLGFFYGGNTAGAVLGCLLAGFYLLRLFDMSTATYVAATINFTVGLIGLALSFASAPTPSPSAQPSAATRLAPSRTPAAPAIAAPAPGASSIYLAIALSGMSALGAEVIWTRLLSLLLGGTVYTFSIILAVFLFGLGIGSSVGAMLARGWVNARMALAWCQLLCALAIAWTAYAVTNGLPNWPVNPFLSLNLFQTFQLDLLRCLWAILPPTLFWGASFPLALAAAVPLGGGSGGGAGGSGGDPAKIVGRVYAANTVGAIFGALLFSLYFVPAFGTQTCEHILIGIVGLSALVALIAGLSPAQLRVSAAGPTPASIPAIVFSLIVTLLLPAGAVALLRSRQLDALPWKLVALGRLLQVEDRNHPNTRYAEPLYVGEGMNSSVAVTELEDGSRRFHVSGKVEASSLPEDMRLQLMLGHFPALFHPKPEKVLIVGCGAGVTAGCFVLHQEIKKIVICEIEPLIPQVVANFFGPQNNGVVNRKDNGRLVDDRVEIVYDDARHYILTTREKFDIITSDPIHPWVKGAATLYTREYFDLVRQHLNPGGLVTQWVPLYESSEPAVKSEIATFFKTFPNGTIWNNDAGGGYDVVLLGSNSDFHLDTAALQRRLRNPLIAAALGRSSFNSPLDILRTYAGRAADLAPWIEDAQINYDRNLRLQYLAGASLNDYVADDIIRDIMSYRTYPADQLTAAPQERAALEKAWRLGPDKGEVDFPAAK